MKFLDLVKKVCLIISDKKVRFSFLRGHGFYDSLSDEDFLKKAFLICVGYPLNLERPQTFNEKIQWLKLHDRRDEYPLFIDKYKVKKIIGEKISVQYVIPTLGVWDSFDDIDFSKLPDKFVLKCTHDSGGVVVVKNKQELKLNKVKKFLNKRLKRNFYYNGREWAYKNIQPRIIAEEYIGNGEQEVNDYKFFCFSGTVKALFVAQDRSSDMETKFDFFDSEYNHLDFINGHPNAESVPKKPVCFEQMKYLSEVLSNGYPHMRVDWYEVDGKLYFGELTLAHWSGLTKFVPEKWDKIFGDWLKLPE